MKVRAIIVGETCHHAAEMRLFQLAELTIDLFFRPGRPEYPHALRPLNIPETSSDWLTRIHLRMTEDREEVETQYQRNLVALASIDFAAD